MFEKYDINSKFDDIQDIKLKSVSEVQKHFGLVYHLM